MIKIGLTGGIGAGKTTIARLFTGMGAVSIEADRVVHQLLKKDTSLYQRVVSVFGTSILSSETEGIERSRLAQLVFNDQRLLKIFLDILYPYLKEEVINLIELESGKGTNVLLFDAAQIIEAGWQNIFDIIILVIAKFDIRIKRILDCGKLDINQIYLRNYLQWPDWVKIRYADFLIINNGSIMETNKRVEKLYKEIIRLCKI